MTEHLRRSERIRSRKNKSQWNQLDAQKSWFYLPLSSELRGTNRQDIADAFLSTPKVHTFDSHCQSTCSSHDSCRMLEHRNLCDLHSWWSIHARGVAMDRNRCLKDIERVNQVFLRFDAILTFASWRGVAPNAIRMTLPRRIANKWMFLRTLVLDRCADRKILSNNCCVVKNVGRAARKRRMLANIMKIIEIASDVVPQPVSTAIENDAVLLAVVVVRLVLAPRRLHHNITW